MTDNETQPFDQRREGIAVRIQEYREYLTLGGRTTDQSLHGPASIDYKVTDQIMQIVDADLADLADRQPAPVVGEDPEQLARRAWDLMPHATLVDGDYCAKREWGSGQTEVFSLFAKAVREALAVPMVSPSSDQLEGVYYDGGPVDDDWSDDDIRDGILRVRDAILAARAVQVPDYGALERAIYAGIKRSGLTATEERTTLTEVLESVREAYREVELAKGGAE